MNYLDEITENSVISSVKVCCGSKYKIYSYISENGVSARFPIFVSEGLNSINEFVIKLISEYILNSKINGCVAIALVPTSHDDNYVSIVATIKFSGEIRYESFNFDLKLLTFVPCNMLLKNLKISKKYLKKVTVGIDSNLKVDLKTVHIYRGKLRFFSKNKTDGSFVLIRTEIP